MEILRNILNPFKSLFISDNSLLRPFHIIMFPHFLQASSRFITCKQLVILVNFHYTTRGRCPYLFLAYFLCSVCSQNHTFILRQSIKSNSPAYVVENFIKEFLGADIPVQVPFIIVLTNSMLWALY